MNDKAQLARWMFWIGLLLITAGLLGYIVVLLAHLDLTPAQIFLRYLTSFGSGILMGTLLAVAGHLLRGHFEAQGNGLAMPKAWNTGDTE